MPVQMRPLHAVMLIFALIAILLSGCGRDGAPSAPGASSALSVKAGDEAKGEVSPAKAAEPEKQTQVAGPPPPNVDIALVGDQVTLYWDSMNPGDYNSDGTVNGLDVFPLAARFGQDVEDTPGNECIDGNQDSHLDGLDLFTVAVNFQNRIDGVNIYSDDEQAGAFDGAALNPALIAYGGCYEQQESSVTFIAGTTWYYLIRSYDQAADELSAFSDVVWPSAPPAAPTELDAAATPDGVTLSFTGDPDNPADLDTWEVGRSNATGGPYTRLNVGRLTDWQYTDTDVEVDETWFYAVRGVDVYGSTSDWSEELEVTVPRAPEVTGLEWRGGSGEFQLGWLPYDGALDHWEIEIREDTVWEQFIPSFTLNDPDSDFGLVICPCIGTNQHLYDLRVRGIAEGNIIGDWTELNDVQPWFLPESPGNVTALHQGDSVLLLMYRSEGYRRAGYTVFRAEAEEGPYLRVDQPETFTHLPATFEPDYNQWDIWYEDTDITPDTDYWYQVRTVTELHAESIDYVTVQATVTGAPSIPTGLTASHLPMSSTIELDWNDNPEGDIAGYNVFRSSDGELPLTKLNEELVPGSLFRDHDVLLDEIYYYRIVAVADSEAQSGFSDPVAPEDIGTNWWSMQVEDYAFYGTSNSIAFNDADQPVVAYNHQPSMELRIAEYDGVDTFGVVTLASISDNEVAPSLATSSEGVIGLSWSDFADNTLHFATYDGMTWTDSTVLTGVGDIGETSLAWDGSLNPRIAYIDRGVYEMHLVSWSGSQWNDQTVSTDTVEMSEMRMNSLGRPVLAYRRSDVYIAKWNGAAWDGYHVPDSTDKSSIDLALGADDRFIVAFRDDQQRSARWQLGGDTWDSYVVHDPLGEGSCGGYSCMTSDQAGTPMGAHKDFVTPSHVFYRWDGAQWDWYPLTRENSGTSSIAIDSNGWPAVAVQRAAGPLSVYRYEE